jgi:AP2 domain/HNH endonuclease
VKPNSIAKINNDVIVVALERKNGEVLPCFVDASRYELVRGYRWCAIKGRHTFYAVANVRKATGTHTTLRMHQLLLPAKEVDHANGCGLDNRLENLRPATRNQNSANQKKPCTNQSGYKGVSWRKDVRKWRARIGVNGKLLHLGFFDDPTEAARAYDAAALKHFGQFARLNFPTSKAA